MLTGLYCGCSFRWKGCYSPPNSEFFDFSAVWSQLLYVLLCMHAIKYLGECQGPKKALESVNGGSNELPIIKLPNGSTV